MEYKIYKGYKSNGIHILPKSFSPIHYVISDNKHKICTKNFLKIDKGAINKPGSDW